MKLVKVSTVGKIIWFFLFLIFILAITFVISLFKKEEPKKMVDPPQDDSLKIIDYTETINHEIDFDSEDIVNEEDVIKITDSATYKLKGLNTKYRIVIDSPNKVVKLKLSSFESGVTDNFIDVKNAYKLIVELEEGTENMIISSSEEESDLPVIFSKADIDFIGNGTLKVESNGNFLTSEANIKFKDATLEVNNIKNGLNVKGNFEMKSGVIYILSTQNGFLADGNVTIESGKFILRSYQTTIKNKGIFIINGGKVFIAGLEEIQKPNANSKQKTIMLNFLEERKKILFFHDTTNVVLAYGGEISYKHILYSDEFKSNSYVLYGNGKVAGEEKYGLYSIEDTSEEEQLTCDSIENDRFLVNDLLNIYDDIVKK